MIDFLSVTASARIDKEAAKRFVKSALWEPSGDVIIIITRLCIFICDHLIHDSLNSLILYMRVFSVVVFFFKLLLVIFIATIVSICDKKCTLTCLMWWSTTISCTRK